MDGLVEAVGGAVQPEVGPQLLDDLLAVQRMGRRQGQQLDQRLGGAARPAPVVDRHAIDADQEAAHEADVEHGCRSGLRPASRRRCAVDAPGQAWKFSGSRAN